jgi:hypothetical protein
LRLLSGVGVGLGVLLLAGLALAVWWWKKKAVAAGPMNRDGPTEMKSSPSKYSAVGQNELEGNHVAELDVAPVATEMGTVPGTVGLKETPPVYRAELP